MSTNPQNHFSSLKGAQDLENRSGAVLKKSLRVVQQGSLLACDLALDREVSATNVWIYCDSGTWNRLPVAIHNRVQSEASFVVDLEDSQFQYFVNSLGTEPGLKLSLYLEIEGPSESVPLSSRQRAAGLLAVESVTDKDIDVDATNRSDEAELVRGFVPLGRFQRTQLSALTSVNIGNNQLTPYVTKKGSIAIAVNYLPRPYMRIHVDALTVGDSRQLQIRGRIYARHTSISDLQLQLCARATGQTISIPARLVFDAEGTEIKYGLKRYQFEVQTPLAKFLEHHDTADDIFDAWLSANVVGSAERHRARIGKNRYLVRRSAKPGTVAVGNAAVSVVPYFTMKVKNVSFQVEYFESRALALIDKAIERPRRLRCAAHRAYADRPVWLVGEMPFKAQDTGLTLFKYLVDNHPEIDARYVIDLKSPELANLAGYEDHVVRHRSQEHVLLSLAASRIIGSHHPEYIYPTRRKSFINACKGLEVFLQHGVMGMKWMPPTYGKSAPGFSTDLFLTSSEREKRMIVDDFGYSSDEVEVTGLSRFDTLFGDDVAVQPNQVLILPTWRDWLTSTDSFTETRFFEEWHGFLDSPEFAELCERFNLDVIFGLHPNMRQHINEFAETPARIFVQGEVSVQSLIKESGIMITDYSSAGLDFSFLHKPLLYFQFDRSRFFGKSGSHFDLDRELPGRVSLTRSSLLRNLENLLAGGSQTSDEFFARADKLYAFRDQNNRERIVRAILNATKRPSLDKVAHSEPVQLLQKRLRKSKHYFPNMKRLYSVAKKLPIQEDLIVFESGLGKQYSDSPRAIYEELIRRGDTRTKIWVYNGKLPTADAHTFVVKRLSPQYFWYLARARYWVNNQNFPYYITRRTDGIYLQTWHGTPLKKMQHDLENIKGRDAGYLDRVTQAGQQWTHLLSPSPYATSAFSTAFRHDAEIIEAGYPRNDLLNSADMRNVRESVRRKLDLPEGKKVLLYAPTFRDDQNISGNRFGFSLPFDLERFAAEFGDEYVILLRMHVVVTSRITIPDHLSDVVQDVSAHDDINELYLASDALITDYSSVFFDYSILERPIIFFAYDLENYRDHLRGFYLDYNTDLPGPVVTSEDDLWKTISSLKTTASGLSARSAAFASAYAPEDDGQAAARVVDVIFGTPGTAG